MDLVTDAPGYAAQQDPAATAATRGLHELLALAVEREASDLHLRPGGPAKVRVAGRLMDATPRSVSPEDVSAMVFASMNQEVRAAYARDFEADYAVVVEGVGRFRCNAFRTRGSDACVLRRIRESVLTLEDLDVPRAVRDLALRSRGLVLVTGPTGSGKSTTLAAMVDLINRERAVHILTLEDPIEALHHDQMATITQRELGSDSRGWTAALRSAMRQDPDVILIGELRDTETVHAALTAAETGHLVLGSMHTNDARETVHRVIETFPAEEQQRVRAVLAGTLEGVICQRLVPRADGSGRACVMEIAVRDGRLAEAIADQDKTHQIPDILATGEYSGMQTFDQHLLQLVMDGTLDMATASGSATNPHDLSVRLRREGWTPGKAAAGARRRAEPA